ncbi:MAG: protein kinase [archaeon]|nr:protein kinase [archaeon]
MKGNIVLSKKSIVGAKKIPITAEYNLGKKLNSGASGTVYAATHKATKQQRAVKAIKKDSESLKEVMNEVDVLSRLSHPNIMQIYEIFQDKANFYIVSELCKGGELLDKIEQSENLLSLDFVRSVMRQLLSAICYAHKVGIVHRDLKPENIMLDEKGGGDTIKVIDWGCAVLYNGKDKLTSADGTAYYIAPEVLKENYNEKCDIWSAGVIFYILLSGYPPFDAPTDEEIFDLIVQGNLQYPEDDWKDIDKDAANLVKQMLTYDPAKRPGAVECLQHKFFTAAKKTSKVSKTMSKSVFDNMKKFNRNKKIESAAVSFIVNNLISKEEKKDLAELFKSWDLNGDGVLNRDEIMRGYKNTYGNTVKEEEIDEMIRSVDTDGNGTIDYNEFLNFATNKDKVLNQQNLRMAFNTFDTDGSGALSFSEIESIFKKGNKNWGKDEQESLRKLLKDADDNGDNEISFDEFEKIMTQFFG